MYYKCYMKAKVSWSDEGRHAAWQAREGEKQHRLLSLACLHVKTKKQSTRLVLTDDCSCLLSCCVLFARRQQRLAAANAECHSTHPSLQAGRLYLYKGQQDKAL